MSRFDYDNHYLLEKIDDQEARIALLEAAIRNKAPRWIPITERLPELGDKVDLFYKEARCPDWYLDYYSPTDHSLYWYSGKGNLFEGPESIPVNQATHWMPLPAPPLLQEDA
jgi:hypothetical protein